MTDTRDIERVPSGVAGLDTVLRGGFPQGGIHILMGHPGTGKTTLGNQICYRHAAAGGRALFVTLLAESHARMLFHLGTMTFFDPARLLQDVTYISGLSALEDEGLRGLVALLRREIATRGATVLVLDGLVAAQERASSDTEYKKFIQELQAQTGLYGCTTFLLTTARNHRRVPPEHTMVDGIVELTDMRFGSRTERGLFVNKLRGSDYLPGRHPFRISRHGLEVYPRIEAAFQHSPFDSVDGARLSSGVERLDAMLGGGIPAATVAGILGPTGIGKTTMGLHFVCAAGPADKALLFGFYETPARLAQKAARLGLDLAGAVARGTVEIIWQPQGEEIQDALAHRILDAVNRPGTQRLFLDGLSAFMETAVEPERTGRFFAVLVNELRTRGITTLYTMETRDVIGPGIEVPINSISAMVESLIALRYLEYHSRSRRLLSVLKVRESAFDPTLREFFIVDGRGISVGDAFQDAEELLSGFARPRAAATGPASRTEDR